jgi:hypothetical protein
LEYWSPAPLPEEDHVKDAAVPVELRQLAEEEIEFSSDSSMGSESEVEITGASGLLSLATTRRKTHHAVKKIPMSKAGLTVAQRLLRRSTPMGTSKVRGASTPPATTAVGSALGGHHSVAPRGR